MDRDAELRLAEAMIREAQEYLPRTKRIEDRPVDGEHAVRPKPTLKRIYEEFAANPDLKDVLDRKYPVYIPTKKQILEPEEQEEDQEDLKEG